MDEKLKSVRDTLNQTVLLDVTVSQDEKEKIISSLTSQERKRIPYAYFFSILGVVAILFILLFPTISDQLSPTASVVKSFEDQIIEEIGTEVFIPEFTDYQILSAEIIYPPIGDKRDLVVVYSKEKGVLQNKDYIKQHEEDMNSKVLYGIYNGEPPWLVRITYSTFKINVGDSVETKTINGFDVHYTKLNSDNANILIAHFNVGKGSYSTEFTLTERLTEERAFEIIETITKENNS
ncbi:hypothetical protein [Paucisalibacillus sp. EB02]|uniref:hypothetical protein n=1 Tax=Paucisalibacillus sp. EB02 TaxID=1347087 RepID=UPI0004B8D984|nr:hypothetical protein [Paucisalibacillus sp. EB02]